MSSGWFSTISTSIRLLRSMPLLNLLKHGVSSTSWSSTIPQNMALGSTWSRLNYPSWFGNALGGVFLIWLPYNAKSPLGRNPATQNTRPFIGNFLLKTHARNCPGFIPHFSCVSLLVLLPEWLGQLRNLTS